MSALNTYKGESSIDLCIRSYTRLEGLIAFCIDNGLDLDHEETTNVTGRLVDDALKSELVTNRPLFPLKPQVKKEVVFVKDNQNIIDLTLQHYGAVEGLIAFAKRNGLAVDQDPTVETLVKLATEEVKSKKDKAFYKANALVVATGCDYDLTRDLTADDDTITVDSTLITGDQTIY